MTAFRMGKGTREKHLDIIVRIPEQCTEIDFQTALDQAEYLIDTWLGTPETSQKQKLPQKPKLSEYVEHIRTLFPEDLETLLTFEEKSGYVIIKPRQFLGSENFAKISEIIKGAGGEYVSAGKASHFRIATPEAKATPQIPNFNPEDLMQHKGWKAKKQEDGSYAEGSLSWGWEFPENFSKETLEVLKRGPVTIDQYTFSLNKEQTLVSVKKKKESAKGG